MNTTNQKLTDSEKMLLEKTPREKLLHQMKLSLENQQNKLKKLTEEAEKRTDDLTDEEAQDFETKIGIIETKINSLIQKYMNAVSKTPIKKKEVEKIGRNQICPFCDSGKKYKKCCMTDVEAEIYRDVSTYR